MRARRRLIAAGTIALSLVGAAVYADVIAQPPVQVVIKTGFAPNGSATTELDNTDSTSPVNATMIEPSGTCDGDVDLTSTAGFTIPASGMYPEPYTCGSASSYGIHRCLYNVISADSSSDGTSIASFLDTCMVEGTQTGGDFLTATMPSLTMTGSGSTLTSSDGIMAGSDSFGALDLQLAGNDPEVFALSMPCMSTNGGCNAAVATTPGGTVAVAITCTPPVAGTTYQASLYAVADTGAALAVPIMLSCMSAASGGGSVLSVTGAPVTVSVDRVPAGQTAMRSITLSSSGTSSLEITSLALVGAGSSAWTFMAEAPCDTLPCTLAMGSSATVDVTYAPTGFGSANQDAQLQVMTNDPANDPALLDLDGTGNGATMELDSVLGSPPILNFGSVLLGGSATQTFELGNMGNETPTITLSGATAPFSAPSSVLLTPGGDTEVTVMCQPTALGSATATLNATGSNLYMSPDVNITLECTGTNGALLANPGSIALGEVRSGAMPLMTTIMLSTTSISAVTLNQPMLEAGAPSELALTALSTTTISSGSSATFMLVVTPTVDQDLTATIDVMTMAGATLEIPISGHVVTATAHVTSPINLGTFCVNGATTPQTARLTATGTGSVGLTMAPALSANPSPFGLTLDTPATYPATLPAGGSASVTISTPGQAAAGTVTDTLTWFTDLPTPMLTATVQASYIAGGGGIQPGSIDFGAVQVNSVAPQQTVTIKNCGTTPLPLGAITLSPPFTYGTLLDSAVPPSGSVSIAVGFTPTMAGTFDATMTIDSTPTDLTVELLGSTIAGPGSMGGDDDDSGRSSLYACSCAGSRDPAGALAIILSISIIVVPRRRSAR